MMLLSKSKSQLRYRTAKHQLIWLMWMYQHRYKYVGLLDQWQPNGHNVMVEDSLNWEHEIRHNYYHSNPLPYCYQVPTSTYSGLEYNTTNHHTWSRRKFLKSICNTKTVNVK